MKISINLHSKFYLVIRGSSNGIIYFVLLVVLMLGLTKRSYSKNFYFSSSTGNDSFTALQAQDPNTPWKTIDQLNKSMDLFTAGDFILFKRGDVFTGQITLTRSGSSVAKIAFSAYGDGNDPIIKGNIEIGPWTRLNGNIWVANCPLLGSEVTNLLIDGKSQQIGRYPNSDAMNKGYLTIKSHIGYTQLTSSSLTSSSDWTGAEAVVRTNRWTLNRVLIESHNGETLIFSSPTSFEIADNFGFFIQNHLNTLDQQGEWYFNSANKKMYLYLSNDPNSMKIEVSAFSSTFTATNQRYFSVENIEFTGSLKTNIKIQNSFYVEMKNNIISESGNDAVYFGGCNNIEFKKNKIINTNSNSLGFFNCKNIVASSNEFHNTALRAGMGLGYEAVNMFHQIKNCLFESNFIDSIGYNGVHFGGDSIIIRNNVIIYFCMILDDGGGLYASTDKISNNYNNKLENNIVLNGIGAGEGTDNPTYTAAEGIYMDDLTTNAAITNNTVANCSKGILLHNSSYISIIGNTLYNNNTQLLFNHDNIAPNYPITDCIVKDNILFSRLKSQRVADFRTIDNGITKFGTIDNNYYCRPLDDYAIINTEYAGNLGTISNLMSLETWQSSFNYDLNSKKSPYTIQGYNIIDLLDFNMLENSQFTTNIEGWSSWSNYNNGYMSWDNNNHKLDGGCLKLGFNSSSGKLDGVLITHNIVSEVVAGENYILKFSMVSSSPGKVVRIFMQKNGSPYNNIIPIQYISADTSRKEYELLITPDSNESSAFICFELKEDFSPIWIDNLEFYKAKIQITNINDSIFFIYNPNNTALTIEDGNSYIDVMGTKYPGRVTLAPYASAVLMVDPNPIASPTIPIYISSDIENINPSVLGMTYNLGLANIIPATLAFSVMVNSIARNVSSVSVSGTKVLLTLTMPVVSGDNITVAYTKPTANPLQTPSGGQAATIGAQTVSNGVNAAVGPPDVVTLPVVVTPPAIVNTPPVVVVSYITETYTGFVGVLNASGSYDADMDNLTFNWKVPGDIPVSATNTPIIEFLAPVIDLKQTFEFILIVSDGKTTQSKTVPVEIVPYQPEIESAEVIDVEASDFQSPYYPYNIIDGNIGTMWSVNGDDKWVILELNGSFNIQHIKLAFQPGQKRESYFDVLGSNDKVNWEPILTKSSSCAFSGDLQVFDFPPSKAGKEFRYVKLVGQGNAVDNWNHIAEIRIFGHKYKNPSKYEDQIVKIYPNPANKLVNILIDEKTFSPDFIKIVSLTGKVIYADKIDPEIWQFQIPIDFIQGVYVVQMGIGDVTMFTQKLIIGN
jgi:uncharacterized repeat protein (TIGR02059 family)